MNIIGPIAVALVSCSVLVAGCPEPADPLVDTTCLGDDRFCDGACRDLSSDAAHCGDCSRACASGETCLDGACIGDPALGCSPACSAGQRCDAGQCVVPPLQCGVGQIQCGADCADPLTSSAFCGASGDCTGPSAGTACGANEFCDQGICAAGCAAGLIDCAGRCVDPQTDAGFCGATGTCSGSEAGTACTPTESCLSGICVSDCETSELSCGDRCADPQTDPEFCGASGDCLGDNAGIACPDGDACVAGTCQTPCVAPSVTCDGVCIDPLTDPTYCGAGGDCTGSSAGVTCDATAGETCQNGACESGCLMPSLVCGGICIDPLTDAAFCGASNDCQGASAGQACGELEHCVDGLCVCQAPGVVCGGACIDPLTSTLYCGATGDCTGDNAGTACVDPETCIDGTCGT